MIVKMLKHRLKKRDRNKNYLRFRLNQKKAGNDLHHLLGSYLGGKKQNDYLLAEISSLQHTIITNNRGASEAEENEMFINSLEGLFDYVEFLEQELFKSKKLNHDYSKTREVIVELTNADKR